MEDESKTDLKIKYETAFKEKANSVGLAINKAYLMKYQLDIIQKLELSHLKELVREQVQEVHENGIKFGGLAKLTNDGGLRLQRVELTERSVKFLDCWMGLMCGVALVSLCITFMAFLGLTELRCQDCPEFNRSAISAQAHFVDKLFFPRDDCIPDWTRNAYAYVLIVLWVPACVIFSLVYPAWQLSLQLAVHLVSSPQSYTHV